MTEVQNPNMFAAFQQGYGFGNELKKQRQSEQFNALAAQAYSAAPDQQQALVGQAVGLDPSAGMALNKGLGEGEDRRNKTMVNMANMLTSVPEQARPALWRKMVPTLSQFGLSELPADYTPETAPAIMEAATALAKAYSGAGATEGRVVGNALVNPVTGQVMYQGEATPVNAQIVKVPDGNGGYDDMIFDPRTRQLSQPQYPGQAAPMAAPTTGGGGMVLDDALTAAQGALNPQEDFKTLASAFPGVQVSSLTRTPEHNREVGGVSNSQHIGVGGREGTAGDFVVPADQKSQFKQAARQRGYEAIDEGDHIHLELPPGGNRLQTSQIVADGRRLGHTPAKPAMTPAQEAAERRAAQADADRARGNAPAGQRFRPDGSLENIPGARTAADKPPNAGELLSAGFLGRMDASGRELDAVTAAGYDPGNARDAMTAGQGAMLNWAASDQGQQYRQQQEDWVRAKLRKESGAAIPPDEMDREISTYFPQPGDRADVIASKTRSREKAIQAMRIAAGRASGKADAMQAAPTVQRATNPQTGEILELRNGAWVPAQ